MHRLTLLQQVFDALVDVSHPLLLLSRRRSVDCEGLVRCLDEPPVPAGLLVRNVFQNHAFQRNDVLLVVLFLADQYVAVHHDVVEEEELPLLRLLSA